MMDDHSVSDRTRRRLTWAMPLVVAGVVGGAVAISTTSASGSSPDLPQRSAQQLLVAVQRSSATALSGQVRETANLGLPSLPGDRSSASLSWQTFVTGSHSARVWIDGRDKQRVALIGELSEAEVVRNGRNLWTYTSGTDTVTHTVAPTHPDTAPGGDTRDITPSAAAARALEAVSPSTKVSADTSRTVAGRPAYTLVLRPRDTRSTVRKVTVAIDATKFVPLQVQVFGSSSTPAFETGFTDISFARPAASTFDFRTPAGATTSTNPFGSSDRHGEHGRHAAEDAGHTPLNSSTHGKPRVIGTGWTAVVELPGGNAALDNGLTRNLTSNVGSSGERLLHTALVNAVIMPDGRTFVGAVSPALLEHIAASTPN